MHNAVFWTVALAAMLVTAVGCEFWAAFVHRVVWHGPLWCVHKSHHAGPKDVAPKTNRPRWTENNDIFGILHAALAMGLMAFGLAPTQQGPLGALSTGAGVGLTLYGVAYGVVHDGCIHGRLRQMRPVRGFWREVFLAHQAHHRTGQAPYGLFLGPMALRRRRRLRRRHEACGRRKAFWGLIR